jgi:hypothetical protein
LDHLNNSPGRRISHQAGAPLGRSTAPQAKRVLKNWDRHLATSVLPGSPPASSEPVPFFNGLLTFDDRTIIIDRTPQARVEVDLRLVTQ